MFYVCGKTIKPSLWDRVSRHTVASDRRHCTVFGGRNCMYLTLLDTWVVIVVSGDSSVHSDFGVLFED